MTTLWLTTNEMNGLAATIGSACDGKEPHLREILDRINDEIGVSAIRASANGARRALSSVMGVKHALMLDDTEHEQLMSLPLTAELRERLTRGF